MQSILVRERREYLDGIVTGWLAGVPGSRPSSVSVFGRHHGAKRRSVAVHRSASGLGNEGQTSNMDRAFFEFSKRVGPIVRRGQAFVLCQTGGFHAQLPASL